MIGLTAPLTQKQIREMFPDTPLTYASHRLRFLERSINAQMDRWVKSPPLTAPYNLIPPSTP